LSPFYNPIERAEERLDKVETKVDSIAAALAAHRADTEGHRVGYQVRESRE
jgi:tetrahydromethanopterin S-methyltransferase subunit G